MKTILVLAGLLLIFPLMVNAEETSVASPKGMTDTVSGVGSGKESSGADCERECQPHQTMKNLVEGRVANVACMQTCLQRKVWEKLSTSIAQVADSLKNSSCKDILVPLGTKMDELKTKVDSLEQKLDNPKSAGKEAPLIK
ncbi:MAG: hypothetical protein V1830_01975 [Candidatus Omnitrophota bacterium]